LKDYDADWPQETHNALFAVKMILKYLIQRSEKELIINLIDTASRDIVIESTRSALGGKLLDIDQGIGYPSQKGVIKEKRPRYTTLFEEILHVIIYSTSKFEKY
jgi:hypothetical protein